MSPALVGYDYFAERMDMLPASVRHGRYTKRFKECNFPDPVTPPGQRPVQFAQDAADEFIAAWLKRRGKHQGAPRRPVDASAPLVDENGLVGYDYFAERLNILPSSVRTGVYEGRFTGFPDPDPRTPPGHRDGVRFPKAAADEFIERWLARRRLYRGGAPRRQKREPAPVWEGQEDLVGYDYFAARLLVSEHAVHLLASRDESFPAPVTPSGDRFPRWRQADAEAYCERRLQGGSSSRGRVRAATLGDAEREAAQKAIALLGREINLASPRQLREALFGDMQLPATTATSRGPSVSTSELVKLHERHPNEFLRLVLRFRGVDVDATEEKPAAPK